MTTEHQDDQRRGGGFREAVNELFGRNERDPRDTSQLDALDREDARRHGDDVDTADPAADRRAYGDAADPAADRRTYGDAADPAADRQAYGDQAAVAQPGEARLDDPAGETTPGTHYDTQGANAHVDDTAAARHGDPLADDVAGTQTGRYDDAVVDDRPGTDPRAQETPMHGQPVAQEQHLGEAQTPLGGEVRGDTVAPEHVRQGGDPTAAGQVQHGGELRGDPVDTRSDADLGAGTATRDAGGASAAGMGAGTASTAGAAHHGTASVDSDDDERAALVTRDRAESYGARWDSVKGEFVDEPRRAVADADALVGELLDELQELFKQQRTQIEQGLDADETSTEDLRVALRRYRSFFDRLLSI